MGIAQAALDNDSQSGWHARLELGFKRTPLKTLMHRRSRQGPLSVQRAFYPEGDVCHVYLLHPPGGVVGGDRLDIEIELDPGAQALLTTPGATKFYRSAGALAVQRQVVHVGESAVLEYLPQEAIYFPGSRVRNGLELHLAAGAKAAVWEIQCLGRPVIGESFESGTLDSQWRIYRDDRPLLIERLRVDRDRLRYASHMYNRPVCGQFMLAGFPKELLDEVREITFANATESLAVTLIDDLLIARYLGSSTENAKRLFTAIWSSVREPVIGRRAHIPRIWNT